MTVTINLILKIKQFIILIIVLLLMSDCKKNPDSRSCNEEPLYASSDFPIGVAVNMSLLRSDEKYKTIAKEQFNSITAENIFKPDKLHPSENTFDFIEADELAEYCRINDKRLHGHTLIWHQQLPGWIYKFEGSAEEWDKLLKFHIYTIVGHFKGHVKAWDVINEAFDDKGGLRNTIWLEKLGAAYIEKAFQYAREADPEALLFYNDYLLEINPDKRRMVLNYLDNLRLKEIKIDGIGLQMHVSTMYPEMQQVAEALKDVSDRNYKIHISELDISVNPLGDNKNGGRENFSHQADIAGSIAFNYRNLPAEHQYGITFWGISDGNSWIRSYYNRMDYPLLFDDDYNPKPAYCKFKSCL
jgi:endo-1,4-beta-xylanase